jgi:uncharacterized protein (TIGR01319 family)
MSDNYLLIDFGSTYTKVLAVDLKTESIIGRSQSPTTVETDITCGLKNAVAALRINGRAFTNEDFARYGKIASSSAAGGLRIVSVGLVPDLTVEAARKAALGAGAKVVGSYAYELSADDVTDIEKIGCDMILLAGGTDGGNKEILLKNAEILAESALCVPFVVAGNKVVSPKARDMLESSGKYAVKCENVLPALDTLNVEPVRALIREIFIKRIVTAKGLDKAQNIIGEIVMPTPMATLKGAQLLSDGYDDEPGLDELLVVEVGGATTNIHSVAEGGGAGGAVVTRGLPEPYCKRTVEGDLGIRYNAATIVSLLGEKNVLSRTYSGVTASELEGYVGGLRGNVGFVPQNERDYEIDAALAASAVGTAVERHSGTLRESYGFGGFVQVQEGKDLTKLKTVIGTGGVFAYNPNARRILEAALFDEKNPFSLRPRFPKLYVDTQYMLYAIGLLGTKAPQKALRIAKKYLSREV